ncbi:hypothetical protein WMY93_012517 [Mugilogobius chulae]|uniref:Uncharacterized protein n=1 Tax=Mugilogobius chulae TaxID=88201 RepID=A0AAW0PH07_9GOBI
MDFGSVLFVLFLCCPDIWAQNTENSQTEFLDSLVQILGVVGPDLVRFALVKCGERPEIEFDLNTYHDVSSVVSAVKKLSQSSTSPGGLTSNDRQAPDALIMISDRNSSGINSYTLEYLISFGVKVWLVGVKEADYNAFKDFGDNVDRCEVFSVQDVTSFSNILNELTQSFCHWIKHRLDLAPPDSVKFSEVQSRRARVSWTYSGNRVQWFNILIKSDSRWVDVLPHKRTTELLHLKPNTSYEIHITAFVLKGVLLGGPGRCSGSLEVLVDQMWSSVCAEDFGQTEAEVVCRELDCGGVSELQRALFTEGSAVGRSFHCNGAETALKDCKSSETRCSAAANITCTDDVVLRLTEDSCKGYLMLRHEDQWKYVKTVDPDLDLDFGSALCQQLDCGLAVYVGYEKGFDPFWRLDSDCVKQRAGLRHCLVHDSNNTHEVDRLFLACTEYSLISESQFPLKKSLSPWGTRLL